MGCISAKNTKKYNSNSLLLPGQTYPSETDLIYYVQVKELKSFRKYNYSYVPKLDLSANLFYRKRIERIQKL